MPPGRPTRTGRTTIAGPTTPTTGSSAQVESCRLTISTRCAANSRVARRASTPRPTRSGERHANKLGGKAPTAFGTINPMTRSVRLAVIAGDGIGPEVVAEGLKVLEAVTPAHDVKIERTEYDLGARRWHATGETLPDSVLDELRDHDAILLGAVGDPGVPSGVLERGLLLRLRFELDHFVNLRPVKLFPGVASPLANVGPADIDFVVIREGTEGAYAGAGGFLRKNTPHEIATEESVNTAFGVERVVRDAFTRAANRPRHKLTLVHKNNVLVHSGDLWTRIVKTVGAEFPTVDVDYCHVDAATIYFVTNPQRFDVIVTD